MKYTDAHFLVESSCTYCASSITSIGWLDPPDTIQSEPHFCLELCHWCVHENEANDIQQGQKKDNHFLDQQLRNKHLICFPFAASLQAVTVYHHRPLKKGQKPAEKISTGDTIDSYLLALPFALPKRLRWQDYLSSMWHGGVFFADFWCYSIYWQSWHTCKAGDRFLNSSRKREKKKISS